MIRRTTSRAERKGSRTRVGKRFALCALLSAFMSYALCFSYDSSAADDPLNKMRDDTLSYFKPLTGKIMGVEDKKIAANIGAKESVKKGMRFQVLREEAPFKHPVTKEPLGKLESLVGKLEIKEVGPDSSTGELLEGNVKEGDKIRISEIKVSVLFCQSQGTDWHLADSYYRALKDSTRFNLIDTSMDTDIPSKAVEEARRLKAEVALLLTAQKTDSGTVLTQRLFWASDGVQLSETNAAVDAAFVKELGASDTFFKTSAEEAWLKLDLSVDSKHMTVCDVDGDGKKEIVLDTGKGVGVYNVVADIQPAHGGLKIEASSLENILWLDSIDLNGNGRDEIIITSMRADEVFSYIYEFDGSQFVLLYKGEGFMRRLENVLIAQAYSRAEGFSGDIFSIVWDGAYKKGSPLRLPKGVHIYDFVYLEDPRAGRLILACDEEGFLNLYNSRDVRIWRSKTDTGGFLYSFTKKAPAMLIDRGEWSIKDRLFRRNSEILSVKRFPLVEMMKSLGFKRTQIRSLRWNGLSIEEGVLIDNIGGTLFDYAVEGDNVFALVSPLFGINAGNILKGENPFRTELFIFKMKGK